MSIETSSSSFGATVDLTLRPSMRALQLLFLLHAAPMVALPFAMQQGPAMIVLAAALLASWLWLRRHPVFGFGAKSLTRLSWHADGRWTVHNAAGQSSAAELLGDSYVHRGLIVLRFRLAGGALRSRALLGDEAAPELLRRLRARLSVSAA